MTTESGIEWSVAWSVRSSTASPDLCGGGAGTAEAGGEGEESGGMGDTVRGDAFAGHGERVSSSFISPSRSRLVAGCTSSPEDISPEDIFQGHGWTTPPHLADFLREALTGGTVSPAGRETSRVLKQRRKVDKFDKSLCYKDGLGAPHV